MDEKRLKPCPFCGSSNLEIARKSEGLHGELGTGYIVRCNYLKGGCGANSGSRETEEEAVNAWNNRTFTI